MYSLSAQIALADTVARKDISFETVHNALSALIAD